jgi:hypothetical protein
MTGITTGMGKGERQNGTRKTGARAWEGEALTSRSWTGRETRDVTDSLRL